jgi:hypothetical protein
VDCHEINAVLGLLLDGGEEMLHRHGHDRSPPVDGLDPGLVERHGTQGE